MIGVGRDLLTLGALIDALARQDQDAPVRWDRERKNEYGSAGMYPGYFHSWRGDYSELTLDKRTEAPSVRTLLDRARHADGGTFEGWKGGDYRMDRDTPVWAENEGDCYDIGIVGVGTSRDGYVVLRTKKVAM